MVKWMLRVVFEVNLVSEIGRACLFEISLQIKSGGHYAGTYVVSLMMELENLIWLIDVSVNGMVNLGMKVDGEGCKKYICERIQEGGR